MLCFIHLVNKLEDLHAGLGEYGTLPDPVKPYTELLHSFSKFVEHAGFPSLSKRVTKYALAFAGKWEARKPQPSTHVWVFFTPSRVSGDFSHMLGKQGKIRMLIEAGILLEWRNAGKCAFDQTKMYSIRQDILARWLLNVEREGHTPHIDDWAPVNALFVNSRKCLEVKLALKHLDDMGALARNAMHQ